MDKDFQQERKPEQLQTAPLQPPKPKYKSLLTLTLIIINISLSAFYFGYSIIYLSVIDFTVVMEIYSVDLERADVEGLITFCVPLGGLLGAWASSYFIKRVSRRNSILLVNYLALLVGCLIFLVDYQFYMVLRVVQGVCAGVFSALVPLFIKELAPLELAAVFGVFNQLFITLGIFSCCFLTFLLSLWNGDETGRSFWEIVFAAPLLIVGLQTVCLNTVFKMETPQYLVNCNRDQEAQKLLQKLYHSEFVPEIMSQLKQQAQAKPTQIQHAASLNKDLRITKLVAVHLALLQQFVGISAVSTYARAIAQGTLSNYKSILPSLLNFEQVAASLASTLLLAKFGKKTILQAGTIGSALANFTIAAGFFLADTQPTLSVALILAALIFYMANFNLSLGPIVWMYIPEIVQPEFLPYSTMVNWGASALSVLLFPMIKARLPEQNPACLFLFFGVWSAVSVGVNHKFVVETRGKTQSQIAVEYRRLGKQRSGQNQIRSE